MGKPTGFMDYERALPPDRPALERIHDWDEFHTHWADADQQQQGARCMNCGIPFCHTGMLIRGAASGCPIHNLIPEWNDLIYRGQWQEAIKRLLKTNNFPEFTGRVCPAPCEGACTVGLHEPMVTIKANECAIIDKAWEEGWITPQPPEKRTGKRVAVIGSGPSGLACADQLNKAGHSVTVYERDDRIGGLLMYGIPNMKLDKKIVDRRIDLMKAEGIEFRPGVHVGVDVKADELLKEFDAVVLACGSGKPRNLTIPGREGAGVVYAVDYLTTSTRHLLDASVPVPEEMDAKGKDVIIIGGGDTGTDCVGTALRQGCRSVHQLEIMPRPSEDRAEQNPWPEYPKVLKTDYAQQEAIAKYGADPREYLINARCIERDADGRMTAVVTDNIRWVKGENGRMNLETIPGSEKRWPAGLVLIAMGFTGPEDTLAEAFGLARDARSNVSADNYQTSREGVFVAGDMHSGQSLVVRAMNEGQEAAAACHAYLSKR